MHNPINIILAPSLRREAKSLTKKFASLAQELRELGQKLVENPQLGTPLGKGCYKIRLAVSSKGDGKSGGLRVITYVVVHVRQQPDGGTTVYLASIYDKSEQATTTDKRLKELIADIHADFGPES